MAFLPRDPEAAKEARRLVEQALVAERLELLRWRTVPVDHAALGELAMATARSSSRRCSGSMPT